MSHLNITKGHCMQVLNDRNLSQYFDQKEFESYYRRCDGRQANAWLLGTSAADYIIRTAKPLPDDTDNN